MLLQRGRKTLADPLSKRNNIINTVRVTTCVSFVWACTLCSTVQYEKQYVGEEGDGKEGTKGNRLGVGGGGGEQLRRVGIEMTQIERRKGVQRNEKDQGSR